MNTNELNCKDTAVSPDAICGALQALRTSFAALESDLHEQVGQCLSRANIPYSHEANLGKGCRADYLAGGIVIEIKRGRPDAKKLQAQLSRYAACEGVDALIVVCERKVSLPKSLMDKPLRVLALNELWGVALP